MTILHGDCLNLMAEMEPNSVDAIVTDPPYELSFMGKKWDGTGIAFDPATWEACLRVLKPGGHLVAFGGTRTSHRMVCAIEDAGFEIRDSLVWLYGSGFPKSLDVSKQIDKMAGAERDVIEERTMIQGGGSSLQIRMGERREVSADITAPATPEAEQWQGWGTALKPGHEPIILARKPLSGTVAANVLAYGTGAINVDACRIGITDKKNGFRQGDYTSKNESRSSWEHREEGEAYRKDQHPAGRWPANVILDETAASLLDAMSGERKSGGGIKGRRLDSVTPGLDFQTSRKYRVTGIGGDTGGASRFFLVAPIDDPDAEHLRFKYAAKASRAERNAGLDGMPEQSSATRNTSGRRFNPLCDNSGKRVQNCDCGSCVWSEDTNPVAANHHPTVKPISLMRWLVRLVTPPGGVILDPFTGSGSTGCAAALEGFDFIGCEREAEYVEIARARVAHWTPEPQPQLALSLEMTA
jgi:DNA modification methylase